MTSISSTAWGLANMRCAECDTELPKDATDYLCWACRTPSKEKEAVASYRPPVYLGDLRGPEGNAFVILGHCSDAWKKAQRANEVRPDLSFDEIAKEMKSGDYDNLLRTVEKYFTPFVAVPQQARLSESLTEEY